MNQHNAKNRNYVNKIKSNYGCQKCGDKREYVLDFHHIDSNIKENTVAKLMIHSSMEKLDEEIKKCVVLCANCHREFHFLNKTNNMTFEEYLS